MQKQNKKKHKKTHYGTASISQLNIYSPSLVAKTLWYMHAAGKTKYFKIQPSAFREFKI